MSTPRTKQATSPLKAVVRLVERRVDKGDDPAELIDYLERVEGAKLNAPNRDPRTLRLAGVSTSCTAGLICLLGNWCAAARRKLEKEATHDHP